MLVGNLFTFDASSLVSITLQDGSLQLNIAMGVAAVLPMVLGLLLIVASWLSMKGEVLPSWIVYDWTSCVNLSRYFQTGRSVGVVKSLGFSLLVMLVVALALGLLLVVIKSDGSLRSRFSTYEFQYAWTFSAAYLHDWAPVVVCGLCLGAASVLLDTVFFPVGREIKQCVTSSGAQCFYGWAARENISKIPNACLFSLFPKQTAPKTLMARHYYWRKKVVDFFSCGCSMPQ